MKATSRYLEFLRALVRGLRLWAKVGVGPLTLARGFSTGLVRPLLFRRRVGRSVWFRRVRACQRCRLYDRKARTCGDGRSLFDLEPTDGGERQLFPAGCQCYIPFKAASPEARCFLAELGLEPLWPQ